MGRSDIQINRASVSRLSTVDFDNIPFGRLFSDHMFVADYKDGKWQQPRIIPFGHFPIHPASMGLHYGQTIFEGMKASKTEAGQPMLFRPEMHVERINRSARRMCMPEIPHDLFMDAVNELVAIDADWIPPTKGSALYIRPFMFANDEFIGVRAADNYRFIIFTGPVGPYYPKPVSLIAETRYVRAVRGGIGEAKAGGNYGGALLPAKVAQEKGFDQVMWLDGLNFEYVQEVGTMNIFFVIDGKVVTPSTDGAVLHGITRDSVMTVMKDKGIDVEARPVKIKEIVDAHHAGKLDEVFGTGTAAVVAHVNKISYNDEIMELPPIEGRKIGPMIKEYIDGLRAGTVEDKFNWVVPVVATTEVEA